MAKNQNPAPQPGRAFRRVASHALSRGALLRRPAFGNVLPSGLVEFGANACDAMDGLAHKAGLDVTNYVLSYGADEEGNQISIYPESPNTPGTAGFNRSSTRRAYTFSVAAVFADAPSLRPMTRRKCSVVSTVDAAGVPCLVLALDSSMEFLTQPQQKKHGDAKKSPDTSTENAK